MAVRYIEVPIDTRDIEDEEAAYDSPDSSGETINLGAFRGLAFALAIEATVAGLGWGIWQLLR